MHFSWSSHFIILVNGMQPTTEETHATHFAIAFFLFVAQKNKVNSFNDVNKKLHCRGRMRSIKFVIDIFTASRIMGDILVWLVGFWKRNMKRWARGAIEI